MQKEGSPVMAEEPSFFISDVWIKSHNYDTHVEFASTLPQSYNLSIKANIGIGVTGTMGNADPAYKTCL